ncbi:MAG: hypothetical protein ABJF04_14880 [Reichenbachiella sp.]|uniref:hypothetical protein n=1 Tax=Reichenbachiella sp. TaxID=2184521 RepID=UPI003263720C
MKKGLFIIVNCLLSIALFAQEFTDNGKNNLQSLCPTESCVYITFTSTIYFPFEEDKEWEIRNMEVATKNTGHFLATGDLYIHGIDTAAVISIDLVFISDDDQEIYRHSIPAFEFYNEPAAAEPIVVSGQMDKGLAVAISYVDIDITSSKRLPYYEISSDCYHACKEHKLKEAMKAFKKAK